MRKLMPLLQCWLDDQEHRPVNLVSDTFANRTSPEPILDGKRRKKRTTIEDSAKDILEVCFQSNPKPNASELSKIANKYNIERNVVRVWFCNRRQREKRQASMHPPIRPVVIQNNPIYNPSLFQHQIISTHSNLDKSVSTTEPPTKRFIADAESSRAGSKPTQEESLQDKAAFSAALMSPQGATLRGYVKPIVFNNG